MVEIVLDLGRKPLARFPDGDWIISEQLVSAQDLEFAVERVCGKSGMVGGVGGVTVFIHIYF